MKTSRFFAVALIAGITAFAPSANAANLVVDGDFTNPTISNSFNTYVAGDHIGAWLVTSGSVSVAGSVDHIGTYWVPPTPGTHTVDLDGNNPGGISQDINLNPGTYKLTFSLSGNPDGGDPLKQVEASIGGSSNVFTYKTGPISAGGHENTKDDMKYVQESLLFTISNIGTYTLSFLSKDLSGPYGAVVGNVAINAVPLPGALLLFGSGLVGLASMAARKVARRRS
jgi:hypothetical protein